MSTLHYKVEMVSLATAYALGHLGAHERAANVRILIHLDRIADKETHPRLRRFVLAQIVQIETAMDLPHAHDPAAVEVAHAL